VDSNEPAGPVNLLATRVSAPVAKAEALPGLHILVCEADPAGLRALCALLRLRGHEVTPARDAGVHLPIVVATAHAGEDDAQLLYAVGADAHVTKPFSLDSLERAVAALTPKLRSVGS